MVGSPSSYFARATFVLSYKVSSGDRITVGTGLDTTCPTVILYQPLDTLYHITVGHDVSRYETMYPVVESSCPRSIRKVKPLDTGHDVMEVLYYFICSVKDNVPFILSNRANEIIQYLHNMVAVHPATSGFMSIWSARAKKKKNRNS